MSKKGRIGSAIGSYLLYAIVLVIFLALFSGGENLLHQNSKLFQGGKSIDLNEVIASGKELPMDEFVHLDLKAVAGQYATNTSSNETYGAKFKSGVDYYYLVLLEDLRVMTVITSDPKDVAALDELSEALDQYDGSDSIFENAGFPSHTFTGKLVKLTNDQIIGYYKQAASVAGVDASPFEVTMIALDATAVRTDQVLLYAGVPLAAIVLAIILVRRSKKKQREEEEAYQRRMAERTSDSL